MKIIIFCYNNSFPYYELFFLENELIINFASFFTCIISNEINASEISLVIKKFLFFLSKNLYIKFVNNI